jgi:hypothetical protein
MNHAISPLVIVDHVACERLGSAIRSMDIPEDREESPPGTLSPARLASISTERVLAPELTPIWSETPCFIGFPRSSDRVGRTRSLA